MSVLGRDKKTTTTPYVNFRGVFCLAAPDQDFDSKRASVQACKGLLCSVLSDLNSSIILRSSIPNPLFHSILLAQGNIPLHHEGSNYVIIAFANCINNPYLW